jgi:hypothetical protein
MSSVLWIKNPGICINSPTILSGSLPKSLYQYALSGADFGELAVWTPTIERNSPGHPRIARRHHRPTDHQQTDDGQHQPRQGAGALRRFIVLRTRTSPKPRRPAPRGMLQRPRCAQIELHAAGPSAGGDAFFLMYASMRLAEGVYNSSVHFDRSASEVPENRWSGSPS